MNIELRNSRKTIKITEGKNGEISRGDAEAAESRNLLLGNNEQRVAWVRLSSIGDSLILPCTLRASA